MKIQTILSELKKEGWFFDEEFIRNNEDMLQAIADKTLTLQLQQAGVKSSVSIELKDLDYECADGCCTSFGTKLILNGK